MRLRVSGIVLAGLLCVIPRMASAQERGGDLAVGYNALYVFGEDGGPGLTLPAGFFVSGGARVGRRGGLMIVGEIADSTKSEAGSTASILTYAGGFRIMGSGDHGGFFGRRGSREGARPFVEILIGGMRGDNILSGDALAIMPGAGVDVPVGFRTAVRIAGKFELFQNGGTAHAFRVDVGVAFHAGRR